MPKGKPKGTQNKALRGLSLLERVERYVDKTPGEHWIWRGGAVGLSKHPIFRYTREDGTLGSVQVRRFLYEAYLKPARQIKQVKNYCGIERCVRPECSMPMEKRARFIEQQRQHSLLQLERAKFILYLKGEGFNQCDIAKYLGIHESTVSLIVNGKRHLSLTA
jgi:hypothetical protein